MEPPSNSAIPPLPRITQKLLENLRMRFPAPRVQPGWTLEQVFFKSGQSDVIDFLEREFAKQQDTL
jgi:hypothetical protein